MLFDLRGRGRRRTVQVIYLGLAVLMGGGLIFFGIGGGTNGGLLDAINGNGGGSGTSVDALYKKRLDTLNQRVQANPQDQTALISLAQLHFQNAGTGENFNQTQQAYTAKGLTELRSASDAWQRYLALNPPKPNADAATVMATAYGPGGLKQYDKAVEALEIVIANRKPSAALYAQLAILAAGAKQDRKAELAEQKAIDLAPKAQRKQLKSDIDLQKSQLTATQAPQSSSSG
jgi:tetratricopeptide (TPR) repeat protein